MGVHVILLFIFAIFFSYLVYPAVEFLLRHSLSLGSIRGSAVLEVYSVFLVLTLLVAHALVPGLARTVFQLAHEVPALLNGLSTGATASDMGNRYGWSKAQEQYVKTFLARHEEDIENLVGRADRYLPNLSEGFTGLMIIPVLAIFLLRDGPNLAKTLIKIVTPETGHEKTLTLANEMHRVLVAYMRAQVLLCTLAFLFYALTLPLMRIPDALSLAILGAFSNLFQPWMDEHGGSDHKPRARKPFALGVDDSDPRSVANFSKLFRVSPDPGPRTEIHPLATAFAVLLGAEVGGIVGIALAVPLTASLRVIWRIYAAPKVCRNPPHGLTPGVKDSTELICENEQSARHPNCLSRDSDISH